MNKEEALKEKFKIALTSTIKVISEKDKVEVSFENKNLSSKNLQFFDLDNFCLLYTSPSPRDMRRSRMPSSA